MKMAPSRDPAARVRMRTDGPPVPIYRDMDPSRHHEESFLSMSRRRLPGVLLVAVGAVMFGKLIGQILLDAS